jgi:hypothetical protein
MVFHHHFYDYEFVCMCVCVFLFVSVGDSNRISHLIYKMGILIHT